VVWRGEKDILLCKDSEGQFGGASQIVDYCVCGDRHRQHVSHHTQATSKEQEPLLGRTGQPALRGCRRRKRSGEAPSYAGAVTRFHVVVRASILIDYLFDFCPLVTRSISFP
jgi:hypothetical protein